MPKQYRVLLEYTVQLGFDIRYHVSFPNDPFYGDLWAVVYDWHLKQEIQKYRNSPMCVKTLLFPVLVTEVDDLVIHEQARIHWEEQALVGGWDYNMPHEYLEGGDS